VLTTELKDLVTRGKLKQNFIVKVVLAVIVVSAFIAANPFYFLFVYLATFIADFMLCLRIHFISYYLLF